jgi:MFS family permease
MGSVATTTQNFQEVVPKGRWWRIIPPTIIVYLIAYMDRVNIGFAMAGGMNEALNMSAAAAGLAAGIFFWGYLVLQVPAGHIAEHGNAKNYITWAILGWGGVSFLTGFVQNSGQLLIMRFLLGVTEGGVYTAILILNSKWFPQKELGRANGLFMLSLPLGSAVTNPISGYVVSHYSWRGLFFFEGVLSLAMMAIWLPLISNSPEEAKWISKEEKEYLRKTLKEEKAKAAAAAAKMKAASQVQWSYKQLLRDKNLWLLVVVKVCETTGTYGYLIFLPVLLKKLTKMSLTNVGWLSTLPLVACMVGIYWFGALSDRKGNRRIWCANGCWGFAIALWLSTLFPQYMWFSYALICVTGLLSKAVESPFWTMLPLVFQPGYTGGATGIINGIGNFGGFLGPVLLGLLMTKSGSMTRGINCLAAIVALGGMLTMLLPKVTAGFKYQDGGGGGKS